MPPDARGRGAATADDRPDLQSLLARGLAELHLAPDEPTCRRLLDYLALMHKWNAVYNLTAIRNSRDMLVQHLLDALAIIAPVQRRMSLERATIADVGSGAGLPGLPLAILHPGAHLVSIEPVGKKSAFQRQVCSELALTNIEVLAERAETVARPCDLVTCRAFATLADFVDVAAGLTGPRTLLAAMKGQRTALDAEIAALPPDCVVQVDPLKVPFLDAERHLVTIRRTRDVPAPR
jgi:16S rRNA (guanine527-N7)-methyltransferase